MDLVESDRESQPTARRVTQVKPDDEPSGIAWLRVVIMILVAIILIVLIVIFARWVYHKVHHSTIKTPVTTTSQQSSDLLKTQSGAQPAPAGNSAPGNTSTGGSSSTPPSNQGNTLPNNGPGNVAAIFVGTSLVAAGIHYAITSRRLNKTGS